MTPKLQAFTPFQLQALAAHNKYRDLHGVPPLQLTDRLNIVAQNWANRAASLGKVEHSKTDFESVFTSPNPDIPNGATAVDAWYNEIKNYNFKAQGLYPETEHFTAIVWKGITKLGIGKAKGKSGTYVVASYSPAGNIRGQFEQNVFKPKGTPGSRNSTPSRKSAANSLKASPRKSGSSVGGVSKKRGSGRRGSAPQVVSPMKLDYVPTRVICPNCKREVITTAKYEPGRCSYILTVALIPVCCCLLPFCTDFSKDTVHTCPTCKKLVGRKKRCQDKK